MNNNIQEDYCSFEVAKLLKEKGFGVRTKNYYRNYPTAIIMSWDNKFSYNGNDDTKMETAGGMTYVSCPTHSLSIKWIREDFNKHIFTDYTNKKWYWTIQYGEDDYLHQEDVHVLQGDIRTVTDLQEESIEKALLYALQNLI